MKRSDFLAIIPALFVASKVKAKPKDVIMVSGDFKIKGSDLKISLDRHKPLNKKIQVQEWKDGKWVTKWIL